MGEDGRGHLWMNMMAGVKLMTCCEDAVVSGRFGRIGSWCVTEKYCVL